MNGQEAIHYIHSQPWQERKPGLDRIRALLDALGNPQRQLKFVHVAGTNGKGSTCADIAAILQAAGYRVGLNTSPYLVRFQERIQVNGAEISDGELARWTDRVRAAAETLAEPPTEFELITAVAMLHFRESRCDIVVLEVGLGGEKDASNVIDTPEVAVITAMGLDHMAVLGPTLADIAAAKAGIVKPGGAVVSLGGCPEADAVIREACARQGAALTEVDFDRLGEESLSLAGSAFDFAPYHRLTLSLAGSYQIRNAAAAITAVEVLGQKGWTVPEAAIRQGLSAVRWPGRFEVLRSAEPLFLLDGAHNAQGVAAAAESLRRLLPGQKPVILLGVLADKDVEPMLETVAALAEAVVTVTPPSPRAMSATALRQRLLHRGVPVCACTEVADGVEAALLAAGADGTVCALGSLYLSAPIRAAVAELTAQAKPTD